MFNRLDNLADRIGADVAYRGVNRRKQHMFASGGPLVSHLFDSLEAAVKRFGQRIKITGMKVLANSTPFQNGYAAKSYAPREGADQQELHEYGSGYLKRLLEPVVATPTPAAPASVALTPDPLPVLPVPEPIILPPPPVIPLLPIEPPAPKKRGRKAKVKGLPIN